MAYRALYRTYRPKTFDEIVGQKAVVKTLKNALRENKIAHAYLFSGPRGTGKTSMARLFAKALNCSEGVGEECNHCENCLDILAGKHPDVYEIDAASNSGVDNVRNLIEQVSFAPILGRYKIYIIDEVHSMTGAAFNALLKTLEEPPANVVFILATTEPNEVLPTILSRVQRFDFSKVSDEDLIFNMKNILEKEGIDYEIEALKSIARMSQGGVRDSLSLLDQAISYSGEKVTSEDIDTLFGLLKIEDELALVRNVHNGNLKEAIRFVKDKYALGADVLRLHDDLINIYKDLLIFGVTRDPSLLSYLAPEEALRTVVPPSEIRANLGTLIKERRNYASTLNAFDQFEMTMLSLINTQDDSFMQPQEQIYIQKQEEPIKAEEIKQEEPVVKQESLIQEEPKNEKEIKPLFEEEKKEETKQEVKIEPKPVENVQPTPLVRINSQIEDFAPLNEDESLRLSEDEIINIMLQGLKEEKNYIKENWDARLATIPSSSELYYLANELRTAIPYVYAPNVLLVSSFSKGTTSSVNKFTSQELTKKLMKQLFNRDNVVIISIYKVDLMNCVTKFKNLMQVNKLPNRRPIVIPTSNVKEEKKEELTNAEKFLNGLL